MITIGLTYYDNFRLFEFNRDWYTKQKSDHIKFIVVDDASPVRPLTKEDMPPNWELHRINEDVGWNNEGAKNLIMHLTDTQWTLLADIDHVLMPYCIPLLPNLEKLKKTDAPFMRRLMNVQTDGKVTPNIDPIRQMAANSYAITKDYFWELGGYDETLQGLYGYDGTMVKRLGKANHERMDVGLHCFTYGGGGSSWTREEKDESKAKCKIAGRTLQPSNERLRFTWQRLA